MLVIVISMLFSTVMAKKASLIIGGEYAVINEYPHSGLMVGRCGTRTHWVCGSSILNQRILLTTAHCLNQCKIKPNRKPYSGDRIAIFFGSTHVMDMNLARVADYTASHQDWDEINGFNDIGLVLVRQDIPLGRKVKRVAITKWFPDTNNIFFESYVAGWGAHKKYQFQPTNHLRQTYQKVRTREECARYGRQHPGLFCAGRMRQRGDYPSHGDSGGALVTRRKFLQIGIISFGWVRYPAMTVYMNTTYYYDWIARHAKILYCKSKADNYNKRPRGWE